MACLAQAVRRRRPLPPAQIRRRIAFYCSLAALLSTFSSAFAQQPTVGILYPETDRPYATIFADIIRGIEDHLESTNVSSYALTRPYDVGQLKTWIQRVDPRVIITLGRRASSAYEAIQVPTPRVIGALDSSPQTHPNTPGISLGVDPALLFDELKRLAPQARRVFVVYDPARDGWLVERAERAAGQRNLALVPHMASDLRGAATAFLQILRVAKGTKDALWLPLNSALISTNDTLPFIIEESWQRRVIVFSHNLLHVDLGVLFGLIPDNEALGRRLGLRAQQLIDNPAQAESMSIEPLIDVRKALNLRMASHLGLRVDAATRRAFDLVYPAE